VVSVVEQEKMREKIEDGRSVDRLSVLDRLDEEKRHKDLDRKRKEWRKRKRVEEMVVKAGKLEDTHMREERTKRGRMNLKWMRKVIRSEELDEEVVARVVVAEEMSLLDNFRLGLEGRKRKRVKAGKLEDTHMREERSKRGG